MRALVAMIHADARGCIRRQHSEGGVLVFGGRDDGERDTVPLELLADTPGLRPPLTDGRVDADHVAASLVEHGVHRERRLAGAFVTSDQLTLTATDREHGVDREHACVQGRTNVAALEDLWRSALQREYSLCTRWVAPIEGMSQRIDDSTEQGFSHRD